MATENILGVPAFNASQEDLDDRVKTSLTKEWCETSKQTTRTSREYKKCSSNLNSYVHFAELPLEHRRKIWTYADNQPRFLEISYANTGKFWGDPRYTVPNYTAPPLLEVCPESRKEVMFQSSYRTVRLPKSNLNEINFKPAVETLYLREIGSPLRASRLNMIEKISDNFWRFGMDQIAIDIFLYSPRFWPENFVCCIQSSIPGLQRLFLVDDYRCMPGALHYRGLCMENVRKMQEGIRRAFKDVAIEVCFKSYTGREDKHGDMIIESHLPRYVTFPFLTMDEKSFKEYLILISRRSWGVVLKCFESAEIYA